MSDEPGVAQDELDHAMASLREMARDLPWPASSYVTEEYLYNVSYRVLEAAAKARAKRKPKAKGNP